MHHERAAHLTAAASRCRDRLKPPTSVRYDDPTTPVELAGPLDLELCTEIADRYDDAPPMETTPTLTEAYRSAASDGAVHLAELRASGLSIRPWSRPTPPYRTASSLQTDVVERGTIKIHLTDHGHGPLDTPPPADHPLRGDAGISIDGVRLRHNDLLRISHDVFGHALPGNGFDPVGELRASYHQMSLCSASSMTALFTENVAQICWFYFGRPYRHDAGQPVRPDEPGYTPPAERPYPPQKVFAYESNDISRFLAMFSP